MTDPLRLWADAGAASLATAATFMRLGQMMLASGAVISHRSRLVAAAMADPQAADHRELGRMVREKQEAFRQASTVAAKALGRLDRDYLAGPSVAFDTALATLDALIDPYHRRSTANARRLSARPRLR